MFLRIRSSHYLQKKYMAIIHCIYNTFIHLMFSHQHTNLTIIFDGDDLSVLVATMFVSNQMNDHMFMGSLKKLVK